MVTAYWRPAKQFPLGKNAAIVTVRHLMKNSSRPALVSLTLALFFAVAAHGDITPAVLFTDHAVLQRDKPVPIWGTAEPGEKVIVIFGTQTREATAGYDGRWIVMLDPLE